MLSSIASSPPPPPVQSRKRFFWISAGVLGLLAAAGLFFLDPATAWFLPSCPWRMVTGFHCPGCGSTRAMHALLHLDVVTAFHKNPLLIVSIPFLIWMGFSPRLAQARYTPAVVLAIIVLYGVLRNIPIWPFTWLAPH